MSVENTGRQYRLFLWALYLSLPLLALLFVGTVRILVWRAPEYKNFGWTASTESSHWVVTDVAENGPAGGVLREGDRVLAWNGDTRIAIIGPRFWMHATNAGQSYVLQVGRGVETLAVSLSARIEPRRRDSTWIWSCLVAFAGFLSGFVAVICRPRHHLAQLLYGCSVLATGFLIRPALTPAAAELDNFERWVLFASLSTYPLLLPVTLYFFSFFPPGIRQAQPWIAVRWIALLAALILFVPMSIARLANLTIHAAALPLLVTFRDTIAAAALIAQNTTGPFNMAISISICAVLVRNYRQAQDPDQQRRIQLVCLGVIAGLIPEFVLSSWILIAAMAGNPVPPRQREVFQAIGIICTGCIPLVMIYAVLRQRVFGIDFVIRRGLQYLLAKNVLQVALVLPVVFIVGRVAQNPDQTVREILLGSGGSVNLVLLGAAGLCLRYRRQLSTSVDRRFFREAYNQETILRGVIDEIKSPDSVEELSRAVCARLSEALHPKSLLVFIKDRSGPYLLLCYSSEAAGAPHRIQTTMPLYHLANSTQRSMQDIQSRVDTDLDADWLKRVGAQLLVPVRGSSEHVVGLLVLGEKKSEEPYSATDRNLLEAIAAQIGMVVENLHLKEQVVRGEHVQRNVLARLDTESIKLVKECPTCGLCFDSSDRVCSEDGAELQLTIPVERSVAGRYRLLRLLGKGGMGAVYAAQDLGLNRQVAVKVMMGALFGDRSALRRFETEAHAAARLNHRNIGRIYDYGRLGGDGAFLVMELIDGTTWRKELRRLGAFAPALAAERLDCLLAGVEAAHRAGIVHRDLKPENVLIGTDEAGEAVKIVDFGLAKVLRSETDATVSATAPRAVLGTLGYMAPEQLTGGEVDERSDIFALGVIAAEAITGQRPFQAASYAETLSAIFQESYRLPGESGEVARANAVLARCLAKEKDGRYGSVRELRGELVAAFAALPEVAGSDASAAGDGATRSMRQSVGDRVTGD